MSHVVHVITGLNNGGAEAVLYRLCAHDKTHRHSVISMMDAGRYGAPLEEVGVAVFCLNMPQGRITFSGLLRLRRLLKQLQPDLVQTWMYHADLIGGLMARWLGIKRVYWNVRHTTFEAGKSKRTTIWVAKACAALSSWLPEKIIYCAHQAKQTHEVMGYVSDKGVVIANGYDLTRFVVDKTLREQLRETLHLHPSVPVLGMVGRFNPQKDHLNLIRALAQVKQQGYGFHTLLIGPGVDQDNRTLMDWLKQYDLVDGVTLLGQRADIAALMNALDLHILSSAFGEAFPNVVAEAMACGTPCVVTRVGDAALIVDQTGWVVAPNDFGALAKAIMYALDERCLSVAQWRERELACRQRIVDCFSLASMIRDYHQVWFAGLPEQEKA
ncbi:MAG: glycosyltransferase [Thiomicrospira sp.]|jgi:glycosyltransferase involved in cell wall biosynthesis|nr:glycosyltransferase [Thiomicrospira sp.]